MLKLDPCPFRIRIERRQVSKQRLAAAARRIQKQKDSLPLFAHEVTTTVEQVIESNDQAADHHMNKLRRYYLTAARELRNFYRQIPKHHHEQLEREWDACSYPKTPSYAFGWLEKKGFCISKGELINGQFVVTHTLTLPEQQ